MGKDGFLTPKAIANRIKAKGLQKLRWFCQICEKQCRDENGFKVNHQSMMRQAFALQYGARRVQANLVYQEFISDRTHLHMNATKWATLTEFVMHLGKEGIASVDETSKGWFIQWIDKSPKTLARQEAIAKKERMEMDDEQREQKLIQQQIEKAAVLTKQQHKQDDDEEGEDEGGGGGGTAITELVRENEEEKIKLDMSIKTPAAVGSSIGLKLGGASGGLLKPKSLNALAAKKPNPLSSKSTASSTSASAAAATPVTGASSSSNGSTSTTIPRKRSAMEEIIEREMAKKKRLAVMNNQPRDTRDDKTREYRSSLDARDGKDKDYRSSRDS
ncbi:hypothetical protein BGZ65_007269, partial [Modicella reniformis]